jgi:hypothetical protein
LMPCSAASQRTNKSSTIVIDRSAAASKCTQFAQSAEVHWICWPSHGLAAAVLLC